ncbi:MAG TPA: hypothetical protein VNO52_13315 [Methylomirabilota bacterium]|nr:hypothetical protein [Methylomirabilota bacterium]
MHIQELMAIKSPAPSASLLLAMLLAATTLFAGRPVAAPLPAFDFRQPEVVREWGAPHDTAALRPTAEGLAIDIGGPDPYFHGPARDYPTNMPLWLVARLKSDQPGAAELFYFRDQARAGQSVRFHVPAGRWFEARVAVPSLGPGHRLRFDPPGTGGTVVLASLRFEPRVPLPEPVWPAWSPPPFGAKRVLASGDVELHFNTASPLAFEWHVLGRRMAVCHPRPRLGYVEEHAARWVELADGASTIERGAEQFALVTRARDPDGAEWTVRQTFRNDSPGAILAETRVSVNRERSVIFAPMHLLMAGEGSFGTRKGQGLLAGLEYLDDEPSSSEADVIGPEANRRVPAPHKVTFPLMAIQAEGRYVGLVWEDTRRFSALFDSPDRTFGSSGHALGLLYPGEEAPREEGRLTPYRGVVVKAGEPLVCRAWIIGGAGHSVVPAIRHYVRLRGWPAQPDPGLDPAGYATLAAQGWLSSRIRETNHYRHAFWPGFPPQPAADAAVWQTWLAERVPDPVQAAALRIAAREALAVVPPRIYYHSAVSHVRPPVTPLVFGAVREAIAAARETARAQLGRFAADGSVPYRASAQGPDYGRTHFAPDANGLTAQVVATLLEAAAFCGDENLIAQGVAKLRGLDKFRHTVPRGAQTWEVPLHTPDILASAHLVRAYTLGYELTGERAFLDAATDWAWTGVPFVYLVNPTGQPVGPYSTIAVLGATSWRAPVWFGRPVQWCGLVYADALYHLARHDGDGPWRSLAHGITAAGLQHTWRAEDPERVGLLPDFYELREQTRAGPAINPATVGANAIRLYFEGPLYDFRVFRRAGLRVHAPGLITPEAEDERGATFTVRGWPRQPWFLLVNGLRAAPAVKINDAPASGDFDPAAGTLIMPVSASARVTLQWP